MASREWMIVKSTLDRLVNDAVAKVAIVTGSTGFTAFAGAAPTGSARTALPASKNNLDKNDMLFPTGQKTGYGL